jgi:hypothetical protein
MNKPGHGFFKREQLVQYKKRSHREIQCNVSGCETWFQINDLLSQSTIELLGQSTIEKYDFLQAIDAKYDSENR